MDESQPFGLVLKRLRRSAGLTHEALAERAGLGARTISDLERGVSRAPRADTLTLLIEALELTADQQERLKAALANATGKDVDLKVIVDPSVIGGLVSTVGDTVIDGTVRTHLDQLKSRL